jgi:zinc protease
MKLIYRHNPAQPLTHLNLIFPRAGAWLDPSQRQGLSHLMLRLLGRGAGGLSNEAFNGRLERLGATISFGLVNDHCSLRLTTLTPQLDAALELLALTVHQPNFDPAEFAGLQGELMSRWRSEREESKYLRAQEVFLKRLYGEGPHGQQADGLLEGLQASTVEDVRAQYQALFSRPGAFLAVLSDLPRAAVEARVLGRLQPPATADNGRPDPWRDFAPPRASGRRVTIVADPRTQTDEVLLGAFSVGQADPDWHLHRLISLIFGGDMNSRLFRVVRGERGFSYGASCWYEAAAGRMPHNREGPFTCYTFPSVEHSAEAVPLVISLYEALVERGVSEEELERARTSLVNSHPFMRDTPAKLLALDVDAELYGLVVDEEEANREKLMAVRPEDVLRVLQASHHPDRLQIVLLGDPARLEPIAAALPGVEKSETIRYPGE